MNAGYVFSGQGAQFVGMGRDLAEAFPACADLYARANEALGFDLRKICFEGPEEALTRSDYCQPAIFTTSAACLAALEQRGKDRSPLALAGLSLGEWTALYAGGAIGFEDGLRALEARGRFMQEACEQNPGGMLSVMGLSLESLEEIGRETGMTVANINSEQQIVLSGPAASVPAAETLASERGARRTVALKVAGAFHSPLMQPARERLAETLATVPFRAPETPVLSNVLGGPHGRSGDEIREAMLRQVTEPVQWVDCVRWMSDHGVDGYVELGPGKVLTGLIRRIDKSAALVNVQDVAGVEKAAEALA